MIKRFIVICITIIGSAAFAQQGTSSPYSFYGIGSLKFKGTVENRSMGGIGVYLDSIHFNLRNPASYAGNPLEGPYFNGESRPIKFTVAGTMTNATLKSNTGEANTNNAIFDYLAISAPIGKFGFGFGLLPFTSVGYRLDDINDDSVLVNRFDGEGGLNRVFAGLGYQITEKLSVGMDFNYNFGNVQNNALEVEYTPEGDVVQYQTREYNRSDLSGSNFNFGLNYKTMITDKLELSTSATYAPGSKLNSENVRSFSTVTVDGTTLETTATSSTIDADLGAQENTKLTLPATFSFGVGIGDPKLWFIGTEYTYQGSSDFSNPVFSNQTITTFENASRIAVGGFYIPDYNAFSGFHKRMVYRAGFNFANTGLVVKNESIKEFGISFGLGLPVGNRNFFSNANLGLEFGKRGTTNQNLIQENFINFNISLSLNSRWFEQKKYN